MYYQFADKPGSLSLNLFVGFFFWKTFASWSVIDWESIVLLLFILSLFRDVNNIITRDLSTRTRFRSVVLYFVKKKIKKQQK